ncbi:MAG TPA: twin transmembrane helix small protein [Casimicrobiaceae bacterium]
MVAAASRLRAPSLRLHAPSLRLHAPSSARRDGGNRPSRCYTQTLQEHAIKVVVIIFLIAIVGALFTALVFLYRDQGHGNRVVITLAIRVGLSMALIVLLVVSWWMGWLQPT